MAKVLYRLYMGEGITIFRTFLDSRSFQCKKPHTIWLLIYILYIHNIYIYYTYIYTLYYTYIYIYHTYIYIFLWVLSWSSFSVELKFIGETPQKCSLHCNPFFLPQTCLKFDRHEHGYTGWPCIVTLPVLQEWSYWFSQTKSLHQKDGAEGVNLSLHPLFGSTTMTRIKKNVRLYRKNFLLQRIATYISP